MRYCLSCTIYTVQSQFHFIFIIIIPICRVIPTKFLSSNTFAQIPSSLLHVTHLSISSFSLLLEESINNCIRRAVMMLGFGTFHPSAYFTWLKGGLSVQITLRHENSTLQSMSPLTLVVLLYVPKVLFHPYDIISFLIRS